MNPPHDSTTCPGGSCTIPGDIQNPSWNRWDVCLPHPPSFTRFQGTSKTLSGTGRMSHPPSLVEDSLRTSERGTLMAGVIELDLQDQLLENFPSNDIFREVNSIRPPTLCPSVSKDIHVKAFPPSGTRAGHVQLSV